MTVLSRFFVSSSVSELMFVPVVVVVVVCGFLPLVGGLVVEAAPRKRRWAILSGCQRTRSFLRISCSFCDNDESGEEVETRGRMEV